MVFLSISAFSNIYSSIFERQAGKMFRKIVDAIKGPPGEGALSHRKNPPVGSCVIIQTEDGEQKATVITWRGKIAFQAQRGRIYFTAKILEVIPTEAQGNETLSFVKSVRRDQQLDLGKKDR